MTTVNINQQLKRVEIKEFEIENEIVFNFFNNIPQSDRDDKLIRAIYIGVLALMEDRISAFLAKTQNELGTELESLKMIFDMKKELFFKSTAKGTMAETDIAEYLNDYFSARKLKDTAKLTGNSAGKISKNKTGDILCELNGNPELKIVIECKFDKSIRMGDIESKDLFIRKTDTAWSQLIEAQANRDGKVSIIVFDTSLVDASITKEVENVGYVPSVGFIAVVDSQRGDYTNLGIAYMLARDIAVNAKDIELDQSLLMILIKRIIKDITEILKIKFMVESNIQNNLEILKQLEKSMLLMEFNQEYLVKFLRDGTLNKKDLLDFYYGEKVKEKFNSIGHEIDSIANSMD